MAERENIGALAIHFTAGIAAGALLLRLPVDPHSLSGGLFLLLASLVAIVLKTRRTALLFPAFLLCGTFCYLTASLAGSAETTLLERWTAGAAQRLRSYIDSIPFPTGTTAPLLKAFLTGDRSGLSRETVQVFRSSGASHLLALSGLHMGILYLILSRLLWPIGNSLAARRFRYAAILLAAGFFTLMTGASPSIVRAFLFIVLNETACMTGRTRNPLRVLASALLIQLISPPASSCPWVSSFPTWRWPASSCCILIWRSGTPTVGDSTRSAGSGRPSPCPSPARPSPVPSPGTGSAPFPPISS